MAERLGAFHSNVVDTAGPAADGLNDAIGATPDAAVPNIPRVEFAGQVLLEHVLPRHRPAVVLVWQLEPGVSIPWAWPLLARDPRIHPAGWAAPLALPGSAHLVATFAGDDGANDRGNACNAPIDVPDAPEGGALLGRLQRLEPAIVFVIRGGPFRHAKISRRRAP